jgi:hypothetical protein
MSLPTTRYATSSGGMRVYHGVQDTVARTAVGRQKCIDHAALPYA